MIDESLRLEISPTFAPRRVSGQRPASAMSQPPTTIPNSRGARRRLSADAIGPVALALFAYAGQIKLSPLLAWVPIDLTLLLGLVATLAVIASRIWSGPTSGAIAIPVSLLAILQLGLVHTSLEGYGLTKVVTLWTFTALSMLAPFYLLRTDLHRRWFLGTLVVLASFVAVITLINPIRTNSVTNVAVFEGTNTIGTARMAGTGVVICLLLMIASRVTVWKRMLLGGISVVLVTIVLGAGSRGPFLAIGLGVFASLLTSPAFKRFRGRALVTVVFLAIAAIAWVSSTNSDGLKRVVDFMSGQQDTSSQARYFFWSKSLDYIGSFPAGIGWGNFAQLPGIAIYADANGIQYPHNLILESFVEGGWLVGFAVFLYLLVSVVRISALSTDATPAAVYALLVFSAFNAMVSGDINDSRLLWILLSCAWLLRSERKGRPSWPVPDDMTIIDLASGERRI